MSGTINIEEENRRRKRINKIKKIIIFLVIIFTTVPTALCGMLMVKVVMLEKEIDRLKTQALEVSQIQVEEADKDVALEGQTENITMPHSNQEFFEVNDVDKAAERAEIIDKNDSKKIYLTFDDGPSDNTDEILDVLKEYNVKATFFVIAKDDANSKRMYKRIVDEGHTLAMHSYTHVYGQIYNNIDSYKNDVVTLREYLQEVTGVESMIYRFPGGSSNTVMDVDVYECISFLEEQGITYFDWNVSSGDATGNGYSAQEIAQNVLDGVAKQDEAVVLLHDASSKDATVEALPILIEKILDMENATLLPLTVDSYPVQHIKKQ